MAYTPTNWECGDVVTAEKLNKLEEAVEDLSIAIDGESGGGGKVYAHMTSSQDDNCTIYTLDITGEDVKTIIENGQDLIIIDEGNYYRRPIEMYASGVTEGATRNLRAPVMNYAAVHIIDDYDGVQVWSFSASSSSDHLTHRKCK